MKEFTNPISLKKLYKIVETTELNYKNKEFINYV